MVFSNVQKGTHHMASPLFAFRLLFCIGRLTKGERLGLGQEVAQEQLVDILAAVGLSLIHI